MLAFVVGALIAVAIVSLVYLRDSRQNDCPELPGPWGLPVIGHLLFLGRLPEIALTKWKDIYGPIYSIKLINLPAIVLNDAKIIKEAFGLDAFTGRPAILKASFSDSKGFTFNDGPRNLEQRIFVKKALQKLRLAKSEHENRIQNEIGPFLHLVKSKCKSAPLAGGGKDLFQSRMTVHKFFEYPVTNSLWMAIAGTRFEENDPTLQQLQGDSAIFFDNSRSLIHQIVWFFPPISRILNRFGINKLLNANKKILAFVSKEIQNSKNDYVPKQPKHFTHAYFDKIKETQDPNSSFHASAPGEQVVSTKELLQGAIEATVVAMDWFLLYMASYPDVQQKLQQEIDSVLQTFSESERRAPCLSDQVYMPYTVAVINELLRMSTIAPTAGYHRTLEDVYLRGYKIPKDTIVIPNVYATHFDPKIWSEPKKFIPERFLESDGTLNRSTRDTLPFGYGKRKCIGELIARDELFLFGTSFFQNFGVQHPGPIPPAERNSGLVVSPQIFDLLVSERFASGIDPKR